jgi:arabinofuranosyltransferase
MISGVWFASRLARSGTGAVLLVGSLLVVSYPIPWVHWWATRDLNTREPGKPVLVPIADRFVWPARPVVAEWDDLQDWLIRHLVGMRHQEHKVFEKFQVQSYPTREEGEKISWDDRDVRVDSTVGIPGWVLPNVAIIDARGLNDRVVARHRPPEFVKAGMAHGRKPPEGYAECFRPNVFVHSGHVLFHPRQAPLTDDEIRACEARDWEMR